VYGSENKKIKYMYMRMRANNLTYEGQTSSLQFSLVSRLASPNHHIVLSRRCNFAQRSLPNQ